MKNNYSKHHIIPKSLWWPDTKNNIKVIKDKQHMHLHSLVNNDSPAMQLMDVLEFNNKVRNPEFVKEIIKVLENYMFDYYNIEIRIQEELGKLLSLERNV